MKDRTQENVKIILANLSKSHTDKEKLEEKSGLTAQEHKFLAFWKSLSFTAHHATQYINKIEESGALMSIRERQLAGESTTNASTVGLNRQKYIYFGLGIEGQCDAQMRVGTYPAEIILPLNPSDQKNEHHSQLAQNLSMENHSYIFSYDLRVDPIEINGVTQYVRFSKENKTKIYTYKKSSGETWERIVRAEEETFYAKGNSTQLMEILGLQFLLELRQFGGEFAEQLLNHPEENKASIIKLFHLLFPSEVYPELRIEGSVPLSLPGLSIQNRKNTEKNIENLHATAKKNSPEEIKSALATNVSIDAPKEIYDDHYKEKKMTTPVTNAFMNSAYNAGFYLISQGARVQTSSLHHPKNILSVLMNNFEKSRDHTRSSNYPKESIETLIDYICVCLKGLSSETLPKVRQHFDLGRRYDETQDSIFMRLLYFSLSKADDSPAVAAKKLILQNLLIQLSKNTDDIGLIAACYGWENSLREKLIAQGCNINLPHHGKTYAMEAAGANNIAAIEWALANGATIYPPSHPLSPFITAIENGQTAILRWLLTQYPFERFTDEDNRKVALLFKKAPFSAARDFHKIRLEFIKHKNNETISDQTRIYATTDHAVGGVVFITVKGKKYTLLVGKSENKYFPHRVGSYCGPGGIVDKNETSEAALLREIKEETGLSLDAKEIKAQLFTYQGRNQENSFFYREILCIDLAPADELPPVFADDDVLEAEWVPLANISNGYHKNQPILRSNALIIEAAISGKKNEELETAVKQALYCESMQGIIKFENLVSAGDKKAVEKMIGEGVSILETNAIVIAATEQNKAMTDILLKSLHNINGLGPEGYTPLIYVYLQSENLSWAKELITQYHADWRACSEPEKSLPALILFREDYKWLNELICQGDTLRNDLFNYIFRECIKKNQLELLNSLRTHYPDQAKKCQKNIEKSEAILAAIQESQPQLDDSKSEQPADGKKEVSAENGRAPLTKISEEHYSDLPALPGTSAAVLETVSSNYSPRLVGTPTRESSDTILVIAPPSSATKENKSLFFHEKIISDTEFLKAIEAGNKKIVFNYINQFDAEKITEPMMKNLENGLRVANENKRRNIVELLENIMGLEPDPKDLNITSEFIDPTHS